MIVPGRKQKQCRTGDRQGKVRVEASKREIEGGGEKEGGIYIQREYCARGRSRNMRIQGRNRTRVYVQAGKPGCTVL